MESLPGWHTIMGLQFENLVLHQTKEICRLLNISLESIVSASSYFQNKTTKTKGACQVDLLIVTHANTYYICEIKFSTKVEKGIIAELQNKIRVLNLPKHVSIRPVLIYGGSVAESVMRSGWFDHTISFDQLLQMP
jgi:hypothetical protein